MFSFKKQLSSGEVGEIVWHEANAASVVRLDGRQSDFRLTACGSGLELKTDYYCMTSTPNFFFERWSDRDARTPGGPWQALANGSKYFVYFYIKNLTYYTFETAPLVEKLDGLVGALKPTQVKNKSWTTEGFRVERSAVASLARVHRLRLTAEELTT